MTRPSVIVAVAAAVLGLAAPVHARPAYFDLFTAYYGISSGDNLFACGVCHLRWDGTGARNAYGSAIEQQVYVGKPILQSIQDIEGDDTDSDGFINVAEISTHGTLPGYNCVNFIDAINPPSNYHTFITPGVASCLDPLDIRVSPTQLVLVAEVGDTSSVQLEIFNNGTDFPVIVSSYGLLAGSASAFTVIGPPAPLNIPVGQSVLLDVEFAPPAAAAAMDTLRISSNDPDEPDLDVPINGLGIVVNLAPAAKRAACLREVDKRYRRYSKRHVKEWERCFVAEVLGKACDTGRRDQKVQAAEQKMRDYIAGPKDRHCAAESLTPSLLGLPSACGAPCDHITLLNLTSYVDCLICRQEAATSSFLDAVVGTSPPDLPANTATGRAAGCQRGLARAMRRGVAQIHKLLARCELTNVTASAPADCLVDHAGDLVQIQGKIDARFGRCADTTNLLGCLFEPGADPNCLGDAALSIGTDLVRETFGAP